MSNTTQCTPEFQCHEIVVTTTGKRDCSICIRKEYDGCFETRVLIKDPVGPQPKQWEYLVDKTMPISTAKEHFEEALKLIQDYLTRHTSSDKMCDFHNPCNTPFVSEADQNAVLAGLSIKHTVRIN